MMIQNCANLNHFLLLVVHKSKSFVGLRTETNGGHDPAKLVEFDGAAAVLQNGDKNVRVMKQLRSRQPRRGPNLVDFSNQLGQLGRVLEFAHVLQRGLQLASIDADHTKDNPEACDRKLNKSSRWVLN